jgi:Arc/MetJ-type ribon-helix-helix transcriptional regulator
MVATPEREDRLARTEARIHALVGFIANGDDSEYVRTALKDLEVQANQEKAAIRQIQRHAAEPITLPTPKQVLEVAQNISLVLEQDPIGAREALRRLFDSGHITLKPQPEGHYVAEATFFPLVALAQSTKPRRASGAEWYFDGCAGAMCALYHEARVGLRLRLVA